ncbi:MAG: MBL fold metallo-hydrolase [Spirochaetia bacterium]|nr:MBL fold metallo-hydrolase [Spirochaetia bacterium]
MRLELFSEGAAGEVTGSRHFLQIDDTILQIDCGAFQGRRKEAEQKNRAAAEQVRSVAAVILTHAHYDHCGMLPLLPKHGFDGNIYTTAASRDLAALIMADSARIQARDIQFLRKDAARAGREFEDEPLYDEQDVLKALNQMVSISYERPLPITPKVALSFYDAGHILGSSLAVFDITDDTDTKITVAFSGDLGRKDKSIIRDPVQIPDPDYLIMESTYGDRLHQDAHDALELLAQVVSSTAAKGGKVIIPAFAVERTQELIYMLHLLSDTKRIPDIPIYVDSPMAVNATSIFRVHPECYDQETHDAFILHHKNPFGFNNLHYAVTSQESKAINDVRGPAVIISSDGMCEAGRIRHHLIRTVEHPENTILIVGYMAAHTLGRRIKERTPQLHIFNRIYDLRARVESIDAFSAHADYREIDEYVRALDLKKLKAVYLVHGEQPAQEHLRDVLLSSGVREVQIVRYDRRYALQ